jgi:geranylgeranyl pyrophosphate synthase
VIIDTGALADLEAHIDALAVEAVDSLVHAPITSPAKAELEALADYVTARAN